MNKLMPLIAGLFCVFTNLAMASQCPSSEYKIGTGELLVEGYGITKSKAKHDAVTQLNNRILGSNVELQFYSEKSHNKTEYKLSSHSQSKGEVFAYKQLAIKKCERGYVAYLVYDESNLETSINQYFLDKNVSLNGPQYLIDSSLLKPFNNKDAESEVLVSLVKGDSNEYFLFLNDHKIKISIKNVSKLLAFKASNNHISSNVSLSLKNTKIELINNSQFQTKSVFICRFSGECQIIELALKPNTRTVMYAGIHDLKSQSAEVIILISFNEKIMNITNISPSLGGSSSLLSLLTSADEYPSMSSTQLLYL